MKKNSIILLVLFSVFGFSQEIQTDSVAVTLDSLYREDQFYFSFAYNNLQKKPNGLSQDKFSPAMSIGFLRDMPINKERTWAIAAGFGYSLNIYNHNLITYVNNASGSTTRTYDVLTNAFDKNKLTLHYIDIPIEIRWRTSTPETHKFWRIYTGLKASYLIADNYKFQGNGLTISDSNNKDLNKLQLGTYLAMGWNTWNAYVFYRLNPIYKSAEIDGKNIDLNSINFGLMFYIL